jgi:ribonucleoside-diphosphate reductase alpha chain
VRSLADAIAHVLVEHCRAPQIIDSGSTTAHLSNDEREKGPEEDEGLQSDTLPVSDRELGRHTGDFCPSCGQMNLVNEEGCRKCYGCGYASC